MAAAQTPGLATGTVTGHVYIQGANTPARLVNVNLQTLTVTDEYARLKSGTPVPLPVSVYQTDLNGSYTIPNVVAGLYYVVVSMPGFVSPFSTFTRQQLEHPTTAIARQIAVELPVISVQPGTTTTHDVTVQKGALLGGTVRFDDGTPYYGAEVFVQRQGADGHWVAQHGYSDRPAVNVQGTWQLSGLLPGKYRIEIKLEVNQRRQSSGLLNNSSSTSYTQYELSYFYGDTPRTADAKVIALEADEQESSEDITIPVSRLHSVSGAVLDAATGQALNSGEVQLLFADTGASLATVSVDAATRRFTFPFVPEGAYKLHVDHAQESRYEPPPAGEGDPNFPDRSRHEVVLRRYQPAEISFELQGGSSSVNLAVAPEATRSQRAP